MGEFAGVHVRDAGRARDRVARRARSRLPVGALPALVSALLALRHAADLLREALVVREDDGRQGRAAGEQPGDQLVPGPHQARPDGQVARGQRRLGALARPLLGYAASGLALHGGRGTRALRRVACRAVGAGRHAARGPSPAVRRRRHLRVPRLRLRDAPRARADRRVVGLGLHAVRAVACAVREPGAVRGALPRGLHLRGARPDARLVLLAARDLDDALRALLLRDRPLPRPDPRSRGPEDVEVPRQHRRTRGTSSTSTARTRSAGTTSRRSSRGTATASPSTRSASRCASSC